VFACNGGETVDDEEEESPEEVWIRIGINGNEAEIAEMFRR
jgi:hypothetical protein